MAVITCPHCDRDFKITVTTIDDSNMVKEREVINWPGVFVQGAVLFYLIGIPLIIGSMHISRAWFLLWGGIGILFCKIIQKIEYSY